LLVLARATLRPTGRIRFCRGVGVGVGLFNIKIDPGEEHNLIATMPEKLAEMKQKMLD
jgi:hypothetical protein